ncbi:MAG: DUF711 family protein, partial [Terriglobales bacterium]
MQPMVQRFCLLVVCLAVAATPSAAAERPKIRAVTAFLHLEPARYEQQIAETMRKLRKAREAFQSAGYEVQDLRIATQPFPEYVRGMSREQALAFFRAYEALAAKEAFSPAIGPAMLADSDDPRFVDLLAEVMRESKLLSATVVVAGEDGVHWKAVRAAARLMKDLAENSPGGYGNFNFAAIAMLGPHGPFFPGAYNQGEGGKFAVAWQAANVVSEAMEGTHSDVALAEEKLRGALGPHAAAIEAVALALEPVLGWRYEGIDLSPAPLHEVSIGRALENFTGAPVGSSGSLTAAALTTRVLQSLPVRRTGYSGMMVPVLEDSILAERWAEGRLTVDALLAYSAVCGTGLDTVPLPG